MFFSDYSGIFSKFNGQFGSHRNIPNLPVLQFGANCYQPLTAVEIIQLSPKISAIRIPVVGAINAIMPS